MRLKPRRFAFAVVPLGVAFVLAWWLASRGAEERLASAGADAAFETDGASSPDTAGTASATRPTLPPAVTLPPRDTPLAFLWSGLQGPAQAGDAGAACRLAIETIRCVHAARFSSMAMPSSPSGDRSELRTLRHFERSPSTLGNDPAVEDAQTHAVTDNPSAWAEAQSKRCEGLTPGRAMTSLALLRAAALAGQPEAQTVYAAGEGWFLAVPGAMASPEFDQWRREAPLIVARMLDAGHPDAPGLLAGAYSGQTWLSGLYDGDPEHAAAYLILNTRLMGKPELADQQLRDVSPAIKAGARAQADALHAKHYAGRTVPQAASWLGAGIRVMQPDFAGTHEMPSPCEPRWPPPTPVDSPTTGR